MIAVRADFPLPDVEWEGTREFWTGAARGELLIPRCNACAAFVWYPKPACPRCGSATMTWTATSGRGRLFSWTVVRHPFLRQFAEDVPFAAGLVALDDDPAVRIVTRLVDCDLEALVFDLPVEVVFQPLRFPGVDGSVAAPFFRPRDG